MILASLGQDDADGISTEGESMQEGQSIIDRWEDMIFEKVKPFLVKALARDTGLEQAESHLGKASKICRVELGLEQESTPHLDKAHNDIWAVIRKHKIAQRS